MARCDRFPAGVEVHAHCSSWRTTSNQCHGDWRGDAAGGYREHPSSLLEARRLR
jgi:hypothetical protein